jgi:hypothetical protein
MNHQISCVETRAPIKSNHMRFWPSQNSQTQIEISDTEIRIQTHSGTPPGRRGFSLLSTPQNSNMSNEGEGFLGSPSQSIAQRKIAKEANVHRESPPPAALSTTAPAEIQGDAIVNSRAYQLEMLVESLKRNFIVAVYFLLLFSAPLS